MKPIPILLIGTGMPVAIAIGSYLCGWASEDLIYDFLEMMIATFIGLLIGLLASLAVIKAATRD